MLRTLFKFHWMFLLLWTTSCSDSSFQSRESAVKKTEEADASLFDLTVNEQRQDFTINFGEDLNIQWKTTGYESCVVSVQDDLISEDLAGSHSHENITKDTLVQLKCDEDTKSIQILVESGKTTLQFNSYSTRKADGEGLKDPVHLHFVIDVTSSMDEVLDLIVNQIDGFVKKLEKDNIDIHLGLTTFKDTTESSVSFGDDVKSFRKALEQTTAEGGGDVPESSLKALEDAANTIQSEEDRPDAIRTLILITDSWGHDAASETYDCKIDPTVEQLKKIFEENPDRWRFFYSAPSETDLDPVVDISFPGLGIELPTRENLNNCMENWVSPALEYEAIHAQLAPQTEAEAHKLNWPFTKESILDQLYKNISEAIENTKLSCMSSEVEVRKGSEVIESRSQDIQDVWKQRSEKTSIKIPNTFEKDELKIFAKQCCLATKDAKSGKFSSCEEDDQFREIK